MKRILLLTLFIATTADAAWTRVAPGVHYQRYLEKNMDIHVARIDLTSEQIRIVATRQSERGLPVSEFAKESKAIVAINADYFDKNLTPVGLAIGPCGPWEETDDDSWSALIAFGADRVELFAEEEVIEEPEPWMTAAVSGWPTLVQNCLARTSEELPGSDNFTRAPHPRTAIGFSRDRARLYFVVAEGRQKNVPGVTLAQLASWMQKRLKVCSALNLDGGGSSAMWVKDRIVNKPSDGSERRVADHIAVVRAADVVECETQNDASIRGTHR